jgi:hypothetical protein
MMIRTQSGRTRDEADPGSMKRVEFYARAFRDQAKEIAKAPSTSRRPPAAAGFCDVAAAFPAHNFLRPQVLNRICTDHPQDFHTLGQAAEPAVPKNHPLSYNAIEIRQ